MAVTDKKGKKLRNWAPGKTMFQWTSGDKKGKIETFASFIEGQEEGDGWITFKSGDKVNEGQLSNFFKKIETNNDIDYAALEAFRKRQKEKSQKQKAGQLPEAKINPVGEDNKPVITEEEQQNFQEAQKKNQDQVQDQKEPERNNKEQKDNKKEKQEKETSDPVKKLLEKQTNTVNINLQLPIKIPNKEIIKALEESFPEEENLHDKIQQVALDDLLEGKGYENFMELIKSKIREYYNE